MTNLQLIQSIATVTVKRSILDTIRLAKGTIWLGRAFRFGYDNSVFPMLLPMLGTLAVLVGKSLWTITLLTTQAVIEATEDALTDHAYEAAKSRIAELTERYIRGQETVEVAKQGSEQQRQTVINEWAADIFEGTVPGMLFCSLHLPEVKQEVKENIADINWKNQVMSSSIRELKKLASQAKIKGYSKLTKSQLQKALLSV